MKIRMYSQGYLGLRKHAFCLCDSIALFAFVDVQSFQDCAIVFFFTLKREA